MKTIQNLLGPVTGLPMPVPAAWLTGLDEQRLVMEQQHPVYLDGVWSVTSFPTLSPQGHSVQNAARHVGMFLMLLFAVILRQVEFRRTMFS